jgi:tRNA A37 threonylcarbamoyladenosine modification protein TsaB
VAEALLASDGPCAAVGDGVPVVAVELARRCGERVALLPPPAGSPDAAAVGRLAARLLARGAGVPAEHLAPLYVRRAEAEVRRTGERFERFDTPGEVS